MSLSYEMRVFPSPGQGEKWVGPHFARPFELFLSPDATVGTGEAKKRAKRCTAPVGRVGVG